MYQILGINALLKAGGLLALACVAVIAVVTRPESLGEWFRTGMGGVTAMGVVLALLGQTAVFPWLCRKTPLGRLLPYLDGEWDVSLESNWPVVSKLLAEAPSEPAAEKQATATIRVRLLGVSMTLDTHDRYSTSKTLLVGVRKDGDSGSVRLHYVYSNETKKPESTDTSHHHGAAYLDLRMKGYKVTELEGIYWTDRNWPQGLNTAGTIRFTRPRR